MFCPTTTTLHTLRGQHVQCSLFRCTHILNFLYPLASPAGVQQEPFNTCVCTYSMYLCMYIHTMYIHTYYVCTYILCIYIRTMYVHTYYVCTYVLCMYIRTMYVHTYHVYTYVPCMYIRTMYIHMYYDLHSLHITLAVLHCATTCMQHACGSPSISPHCIACCIRTCPNQSTSFGWCRLFGRSRTAHCLGFSCPNRGCLSPNMTESEHKHTHIIKLSQYVSTFGNLHNMYIIHFNACIK